MQPGYLWNKYRLTKHIDITENRYKGDILESYGTEACVILAQVVKSRHAVENELLYSNELTGLLPDEYFLSDIVYCEIRNIEANTMIIMNRIEVTFDFDMVVVYQYNNGKTAGNLYNIHTEKVRKAIYVEKSNFAGFFDNSESTVCQCRVKNIRYYTDIGFEMEKLDVSVHADIEYLILQEEMVEIDGYGHSQSMDTYRMPYFPECVFNYINEIADAGCRLEERIEFCEKQALCMKDELIERDRQIASLQDSNKKLDEKIKALVMGTSLSINENK